MTTVSDGLFQYGGVPVGGLETFGMGNIYYACDSDATVYDTDFVQQKIGNYSDGTDRVHTTVQSALDACTTQRNDYVILLSNFTITSALTMSKSRVHLISPGGLKLNAWPGDFSITQSTGSADCITITGHGNEVAGIWFNGKTGADIIDLDSTWVTHIHHNYFAMSATASSDNYGIVGTAPVQPSIHHNFFCNHSPGAMTSTDNDIAAFIGITSGAATRGYIADNVLTTYLNTAVAKGIQWAGCECIIARNVLWESAAHGASEAGTFTLGISTAADNIVVDNRIGMGTPGNGVSGGTANQSYIENWEGTSGNTILT